MAPQNFQMNDVKMTVYTKHFRTEIHHKWTGNVDGDNRDECERYQWITKYTFESHIQDITPKV